jgi:hypothetical protein
MRGAVAALHMAVQESLTSTALLWSTPLSFILHLKNQSDNMLLQAVCAA